MAYTQQQKAKLLFAFSLFFAIVCAVLMICFYTSNIGEFDPDVVIALFCGTGTVSGILALVATIFWFKKNKIAPMQ